MGLFRRKAVPRYSKRPADAPREYFYLGESLAQTRLKCGHFIYVDPLEESVCSHLIAHGQWEPWARNIILDLISPGDHIVEVGCHVGYYTLGMAHKVGAKGSVTSFEANPRMAALAQRSIRFSGYAGWTKIIQKAVSNETGRLRFMISRQFAGGGHLFIREGALSKDAEAIEVQAIRLDDVKLPKVRLIRIDAEGSEALILQGAEKLLDTPDIIICMEWDVVQMRSRSNPAEFAQWLEAKGFKFWQILTTGKLQSRSVEELATLGSCDLILSRDNIFS